MLIERVQDLLGHRAKPRGQRAAPRSTSHRRHRQLLTVEKLSAAAKRPKRRWPRESCGLSGSASTNLGAAASTPMRTSGGEPVPAPRGGCDEHVAANATRTRCDRAAGQGLAPEDRWHMPRDVAPWPPGVYNCASERLPCVISASAGLGPTMSASVGGPPGDRAPATAATRHPPGPPRRLASGWVSGRCRSRLSVVA